MFIGLCFATATIGDCSLVILDEPTVVRSDNTTATTLGMLSYRDAETDRCYWWSGDAADTEDIAEVSSETVVNIDNNGTYISFLNDGINATSEPIDTSGGNANANDEIIFYLTEALGQDWRVSMGLCGAALGLGVIIFLYSTSFFCSTQVRGFRVFLGALVGVVMPLFMGLGTVMVHQSEWCDILGCSMGRSTIFSIVAAVSFLLSGIFYWTMENWPGQKELDDMEKKRTWMKDPYKKKRSSSRHSKTKHESPQSSRSFHKNNNSNRSSRRTDHTGGTHLRNSNNSLHNDHTSRLHDGSDSDASSIVSSVEIERPVEKKTPPKRPSNQKRNQRSAEFKMNRRDESNGSDRYSDEPCSPIRRSRPRKSSNRTSQDRPRRSDKDESSSEMNAMNKPSSSTYLDTSQVAVNLSSSHIRSMEDLDGSRVASSDSAHIRSIESLDDSRVADHEESTHMEIKE